MTRALNQKLLILLLTLMLVAGCGEGGGGASGGGGGPIVSSAPATNWTGGGAITSSVPTSELTAIANTILLLNFNGNTTDATARHAATDQGSTNDNVNKKFGVASRDFLSTSSQYVTFADHADWDFAASNFTIEFWLRTNSAALMYLFGQYAATCVSTSNTVTMNVNNSAGKIQAIINDGGTNRAITSTTSVNDGAWHHVKLERSANSLLLYIDGLAEGSSLSGLGSVPGSANNFSIGRTGDCAAAYFDGNIDDFRIVK